VRKLKFEYIYAILLLSVLTAALFIFRDNDEVVTTIVTVLVGAISSITAFFFTKHVPKEQNNKKDLR